MPAGGVSLPLLAQLGRALDAILGTRHHVAPPLELLPAWTSRRGVRSGDVLDALLARVRADDGERSSRLTLAVADAVLLGHDGRRVFGEAAVGAGCAVLGLRALGDAKRCGEATLLDRATKAALHEAAHAAGLEHCADPGCVMYPARDIADVDRKAKGFCARCGAALAHATLDAARS